MIAKPSRGKKHKTKADKDRFAALKRMGCCICWMFYKQGSPADIHHIETGMGRRKDHQRTIPLCKSHHQIGPFAVHVDKRRFERLYDTESDLLAKVNKMLAAGLMQAQTDIQQRATRQAHNQHGLPG